MDGDKKMINKIEAIFKALETINVSGSKDIMTMNNIFKYLNDWSNEIVSNNVNMDGDTDDE